MSIRAIFVLVVTGIGIFLAFFADVFYGVLLYSFYTFFSPMQLIWGSLGGIRLSFITAAAVVVFALIQRQKIIAKHSLTFLCLFFLFICWASLAMQTGVTEYSWDNLQVLLRIIAMTIIIAALLNTTERLRLYIFSILVFAGLLNAYYGFGGILAGSTNIAGPGRIGDNNGFAVMLNTCLPFIYYAGLQIKHRFGRHFTKLVFVGNIIAIMLTFSRGGFVTLIFTLTVLFSKFKNKVLVFSVGLIMVISIMLFMPLYSTPKYEYFEEATQGNEQEALGIQKVFKQYIERIETLGQDKEEIGSAISRMHFWNVAFIMANENPFLGVGWGRYKTFYNDYDTAYGEFGYNRAVHSNPLKVLSEMGYIGFFVYILIFLACLTATKRTRKSMLSCPNLALRKEFLDYTKMLRLSMLVYFIGSLFVTTINQEIFWAIITISIALDKISQQIAHNTTIKESEGGILNLSKRIFSK